jgi:endonuclease/exonuclease/phosphatase family metal-dependent hydrolase
MLPRPKRPPASTFARFVSLAILGFFLAFPFVGCDSTGSNGGGNGDDSDPTPGSDPVDGFTSQAAPIVVDGEGDDWTNLDVRQADMGDEDGPIGIERLWMAHTERHLFFRLTVDRQIKLQEDNDLTLYLDTDNDPTTGEAALGLGAELQWTFGQRAGRLGNGETVSHEDIGITSLPTVRADTFELALDRSTEPGGEPLFSGDSIRIGLSSSGDRLPDEDGGLGYALSETEAAANAPSIDRPSASDVRLLSYNVPNNFDQNRSSLFETDAQPSYLRILQATGPDVIGFQEMYDNSADEIEQVVESEIDGVPNGWTWAKTGGEFVLGSRYPIRGTHRIPGAANIPSGAFLLDTQAALGDSLVVVLMHPKCCSGISEDRSRQETVDGVVAFLREVQRGEGPFGISPETPIVVTGDMNFVGDPQQPRTLRTGEIQNTDEFGEPVAPDWDGSPLLDTNPRQTAAPLHTTFFSPGGFPPGRLDYTYVTDSVLDVVHEFALTTRPLSDAELEAYGLQRDDTVIASDHLPLVVDLTLR